MNFNIGARPRPKGKGWSKGLYRSKNGEDWDELIERLSDSHPEREHQRCAVSAGFRVVWERKRQ